MDELECKNLTDEINACIKEFDDMVASENGCVVAKDDEEKNESAENDGKQEKSAGGILGMLVKALADELLAENQYWVCRHLAKGVGRVDAIPEFEQHEKDEHDHAEKLMLRIKELGGEPITSPAKWEENGNPWTEVTTSNVCEQLDITIKAEQDAIDYYQKIVEACRGGKDDITIRLVRSIMSDEAEHLYDLQMLKDEICA